MPITSVVGASSFEFTFFNEGGRNNPLPGRATTQQLSLTPPAGAGAFACLQSFQGGFVTNGDDLTERPLGKFEVTLALPDRTTLSCTVRLTDSNGDDPVKVTVRGILVFFV